MSALRSVLQQAGNVSANLAEGWRLVWFRAIVNPRAAYSLDQVVILLALGMLIACALSYLVNLPDPRFNPWAILVDAASTLNVLLFAYLFARWFAYPALAVCVLVRLASASIVLMVVLSAVYLIAGGTGSAEEDEAPRHAIFYWASIAWGVCVATQVLHQALHRARPAATLAGMALYVALVVAPGMFMSNYVGWYWYPGDLYGDEVDSGAEQESYAAYDALNVESIYYEQAAHLDTIHQGLLPGGQGRTDLYFVGFGGYAMQNVFMHEVRFAQALFDRRFGTRGRSVALINNLETVHSGALANRHNLDDVLGSIGSKMNRDEDVLFLYLTSHGSKNARLAVEFWPLGLEDLTVEELRAMLDRAQIRWRIIVVSACYSGAFLEPLRDDYTLIATASAADRTSFGCSNERDFTYFGEALLQDALSREHSLRRALELAIAAIEKRELDEGLDPSLPQLYVGAHMERKLTELEQSAGAGGIARVRVH